MRRRRMVLGLSSALAALTLAGCAGDDEGTTREPAPSVEAPREGTTTPTERNGLPPGFVECMAKQGYEVKSSADIHSAPAAVLQSCFRH